MHPKFQQKPEEKLCPAKICGLLQDSAPRPGTMVSRAEFDSRMGALLFRGERADFDAAALAAALGGVFAVYDRRHVRSCVKRVFFYLIRN